MTRRDAVFLAAGPRLVDCQTLFSSDPGLTGPFADCGFESAARVFMTIERAAWLGGKGAAFAPPLRSRPIERTDLRSVAHLVYEAHIYDAAFSLHHRLYFRFKSLRNFHLQLA